MQRIVIFVDWYKPAYKAGGPVQSVINLVDSLKDYFLIDIVTSDRDFGDSKPFDFIELNTWITESENVRVIYLSPENHFSRIVKILKEGGYYKIYFNSFFSFKFTLQPLLISYFKRDRIILAPRGMLGRGALELKSFKKRLFISFFKFMMLDKRIIWHATSDQELIEIKSEFENVFVKVIPNISRRNELEISPIKKEAGRLHLCFLSRISPKKNLKWALDFLALFYKSGNKGEIVFDIYGPIEDEFYWRSCLAIIKENTNPNLIINYCGELAPNQVGITISKYHYLFLPTKNENFGHVIAESLMVGRPVLISDQTPWRNLKSMGAGFDFSLNHEEILITEFNSILEQTDEEFKRLIDSSIKYFNSKNNPDQNIDLYKRMFSE